jgi:uncharacterized protein
MQPMIGQDSLPVSQEQIEDVLERCGTSVDWATGFFAAVHTGPSVLAPSDWVPHFTPETGFADNQDATASIVTLLHLYNRIGSVLTDNPGALCPDHDDVDGIEEFCNGYVSGVQLHGEWRKDKIASAAVVILAVLAGLVPREELKDSEGNPWPDLDDFLDRQRVDLRDHVRELWKHWAPARKTAAASERAKKQVGRNDPCPCGSGKKYKKCCLAS